jgi:acyl carrier protein
MDHRENIELWLKQLLARSLKVPKAKIDPTVTFDRLGLDSTSAVALALDIEEHFGVPMTETVFFDHPSLAELADYLVTVVPKPS